MEYKRGIDYRIIEHPQFRGKKLIEINGILYKPTVRCSYDKDYEYQAESFLSYINNKTLQGVRIDRLVEYKTVD